ncbi:MAG: GTP-dependent dephospho-CoA kinase family protein [Candidatus Hydrothermarchaeales archaeon]
MRDIKLPDEMRGTLRKPFGMLIKGDGKVAAGKVKPMLAGKRAIVVGDASYENLLSVDVKPHMAVLDFMVKRKPYKRYPAKVSVENPAGVITASLWKVIEENLESGGIIGVEGEEDLAVIPAVLEADFGDVVLYGQPDEGMVYINVDEEVKQRTAMLLRIMESLQE